MQTICGDSDMSSLQDMQTICGDSDMSSLLDMQTICGDSVLITHYLKCSQVIK